MKSDRDKYGFKTLKPGEKKIVMGVVKRYAQTSYGQFCRRFPEMIHKDFEWRDIEGGVEIERIR